MEEENFIDLKEYSHADNVNTGISPFAVSPVPGVDASAFKTPGNFYFETDDSYGYYRETYEWPFGSGNYLTDLMKYSWILQTPGPSGRFDISLKIVDSTQYLYNSNNDTITAFDTENYLKLKDQPNIAMALEDNKSDIVVGIHKYAQCDGVSLTVNWSSLIGLIDWKTQLPLSSAFGLLSFKNTGSTSPAESWDDSIYSQIKSEGNVIRGEKFSLKSSQELKKIGDLVTMEVRIKKPNDASSYYTYNTSSRKIHGQYNFVIYRRNGLGLYTDKRHTVTKKKSISYTGTMTG